MGKYILARIPRGEKSPVEFVGTVKLTFFFYCNQILGRLNMIPRARKASAIISRLACDLEYVMFVVLGSRDGIISFLCSNLERSYGKIEENTTIYMAFVSNLSCTATLI